MAALLHALHDRLPLPTWEPKAAAAMMADAKRDPRAELAEEVGRLKAEVTILRNQLSVFTGQHEAPTAGHLLATVKLDDAPVMVEHSYFDGVAKVVGALINGRWINPRDFIAEAVVDGWERELSGDAE